MPKVSIIIPVYNAEKYLEHTLKSIINQTFKDFEVIAIDDGSIDESYEILKKYSSIDSRFKVLTRENRGLAKTLNQAIQLSSSPLIARIDADDIMMSERLETQVKLFDDSNIVLCGSSAIYITQSSIPIGYCRTEKEVTKEKIIISNGFIHPSVMFRKHEFLLCGGYDEGLGMYFEDHLLWSKLLDFGRGINIQKPLIKYRLHPNAISSTPYTDEYISIVRKSIENGFFNINDKEYLLRIKKDNQLTKAMRHKIYNSRVKRILLSSISWSNFKSMVFND